MRVTNWMMYSLISTATLCFGNGAGAAIKFVKNSGN